MELITIGIITGTHGLKGTFKVKSFTDFKTDRYKKGRVLYISFKQELIPVTVASFQTVKSIELVSFKEFNDINQIEKYKGSNIMFDKNLAEDLLEDEFYFDELIGLDVYLKDKLVGTCVDVREYPQGEVLVVKRKALKDVLIPFQKEFIEEVNKDLKRILLIEWEGLLWLLMS